MSETLTTMLAQPWSLSTSYTATVTDSGAGSPRTVMFNPTGTVWYRTYLAPTGAAGAVATAPKEFLAYCDGIVGGVPNLWSLAMTATGQPRWTYLGTGTGSIVWTTSSVIRSLLGFTGTVTCVGTNAKQDATYTASHCVFSRWRQAIAPWRGEQVGAAITELDNGVVDFMGGTYNKFKNAFSLRAHPLTPTDALALSTNATPVYPDHVLFDPLWQAPTLTPLSAATQYSLHQFLATSKGYELGYTLGEFGSLVSGGQTYFDEGYWSKKTLGAMAGILVPGWEAWIDANELELTRTARTVIT